MKYVFKSNKMSSKTKQYLSHIYLVLFICLFVRLIDFIEQEVKQDFSKTNHFPLGPCLFA